MDKKSVRNRFVDYNSGNAAYGLGFLGALIYYISTATSLWAGVVGVVKSIFWPTVLVYELLRFLGV